MQLKLKVEWWDKEGYHSSTELQSINHEFAHELRRTPEIKRVVTTTVIECCDEELECRGFTNTCPQCGADYNGAGQRLASRSQWGEETGESVEDILSVDYPGFDPDDVDY